jgi:F-type H+-transporting ATPase subunit b
LIRVETRRILKKASLFILALVLAFAVALPSSAQAPRPEEKTSSNSVERSEVVQEQQNETAAYRHSGAVQAVGRKLGLQPEGAARLFEFINFSILAIAVLWFLVKVLPRTLRARSERIASQLVEARTLTEDANKRLSSVEQRLARIDDDIAAIRAQSEAEIRRDEARMKDELEAEKKKIIAAAEQEIASASAHAQRDLKQYAAALAIEQAARSLNLTPETDRALVENFAASLGSKRELN